MKIASWILRCIVAAAFVAAALMKLVNVDESARRFAEWGYPPWILYVVATIEMSGGLGLLLPKTAQAASGALILLLIGAVYTHFANGDSLVVAGPAIMLLILLSFIVLLQRQDRGAIEL